MKHAQTLVALAVLAGLGLVLVPTLGARQKPAHAAKVPDLHALAWLAGHWGSEADGVTTEEAWLAPAGGLLLGVNRSVSGTERGSFEFLRIEARADGIVYVASPGGQGATEFRLKETGERTVLFENPAHDFPQQIRYELDAAGALHARVSGKMGEEEQAMEWTWKRR